MSAEQAGQPAPRVRLAAFYFVFFATVGAFQPYWPLYLEGLGFTDATIGTLMALLMATRIVAPNLWAAASDAWGRRMPIVRLGALAGVAVFALTPLATTGLSLGVLLVLYSVFWSAVLPQFEALTLTWLGARRRQYSRLRLWGSVGFVVTSTLTGAILERTGIGVLPGLLLVLFAAVAAMTVPIREPARAPVAAARVGLLGTLRSPPVMALMAGCVLMQASHAPYYVFFSIYLEDHAYSPAVIGTLWSLGVVAEVAMFAVLPPLLARFHAGKVFTACFLITAGRWLMLAFLPASPGVLVAVQLLHAVSFGAFHAVAIQFIHAAFTGAQQARGQALYSSVTFGAGGALGSIASGWSWAGLGPGTTFAIAGAVALAGGAVVWWGLGRAPAPPEPAP